MVNRTKYPFVCKTCGNKGGVSHKGLCQRCYNREYYSTHRSNLIQNANNWKKKNPEKARESNRESAKRHWKKLTAEEKKVITREQEKRRSPKSRERKKAYAKEYYQNHKENWPKTKHHYSKEAYRKEHPINIKYCEECNKPIGRFPKTKKCGNCRQREKYESDPEYRKKINNRNINNNHKESYKAKKRLAVIKRRTQVANLEFTLTKEEWEKILEKFKYRCAYCRKEGKLEMDHVIPISKGGPTTKENIVPACRSCNSKKGNRIGIIWHDF